MKKNLLLIFALLCAVAQGMWSQNVVDLSTTTSDFVAQDGDVLMGVFSVRVYKMNAGTPEETDEVGYGGAGVWEVR